MSKKEPTLFDRLATTWSANHGWLLIGMGGVAAAIMSLVWYFNVLPDVQLVPENSLSSSIAATSAGVMPVVITGAEDQGESPQRGMVLLLAPSGQLEEEYDALITLPFQLDDNGYASVLVQRSQFNSFAVLAYLDVNENGRLDFEKGQPIEPVRHALSPRSNPDSFDLLKIASDMAVIRPSALQFDFQPPSKPRGSQ